MADPVLASRDGSETVDPALRGPAPGFAPPALPYARVEAEALAEKLGPGSQVLVGRAATERAFKSLDLQKYAVLHFGAHAIANHLRASRSAILLARAAPDDGFLEAGEIAALPLTGQLVVLSACETAEGRVAAGEGALSLTHAFLSAGARAVLSTLWPVRDADAHALIERFYAHLATGATAATALTAAQRELSANGAPPASWAAFVLVGDAGWTLPPVPPRSSWHDSPRMLWIPAIGVALAALLAAGYLVTRARRAH